MNYPEIIQLKKTIENHTIHISEPQNYIRNDLFFVTLSIGNKNWEVLVDDEFQDFKKGSQVLRWFLVLFALDIYKEAEDILEWSKEHNIHAEDFLTYYKTLGNIYFQLEKEVGSLDPLISDFEYTLRAGAYQQLSQKNGSH